MSTVERKIPKLFQAIEQASTQETSRAEINSLDKCPVCSNLLTHCVVNGKVAKLCSAHKIVLPIKD